MARPTSQCSVFIVESDLCIAGQTVAAKHLKDAKVDDRFRVDLGKIFELVVKDRPIANAYLYASFYQCNDSVWQAAGERNFKVKTINYSGSGHEKEVDVTMAKDIMEELYKTEDDKTFIIVTGDRDRDFVFLIKTCIEKNVRVELWSWEHSMAKDLKDLAKKEPLFTAEILDNKIDCFSFTACMFRNKKIDPEHAIVYNNVPTGKGFIPELISHLNRLSRLFYITPTKNEDAIIVEFPYSEPKVVLAELEKLKTFSHKPYSYKAYKFNKFIRSHPGAYLQAILQDPLLQKKTILEIRSLLLQAIYHGYKNAVEEVTKELHKEDTSYLDFICTDGSVPERLTRGCSPLMLAVELEKTDIVKLLINLGASVFYTNQDGVTALHIACKRGLAKMVEIIMTAEIKGKKYKDRIVFNMKEHSEGNTPLMYAVESSDLDTVKEIMKYHFLKYDAKNNDGNTALHIAHTKPNVEIANLVSDVAREKGFHLERLKNKHGKLPREMDIDESLLVIPQEIQKLDKVSIKLYLEALSDGKAKIPYCGLVIVGRERGGKTSLYRQLVGQTFDPNLCSTRGINNEEISALADSRNIEADLEWQEKDSDYYVDALHENLHRVGLMKSEYKVISEESILEQLSKITSGKVSSQNQSKYLPVESPTTSGAATQHAITTTTVPGISTADSEAGISEDAGSTSCDITSEQVAKINEKLKSGQRLKKTLSLNVLDFAGQKEYRPMHRCFLPRRALYLLVFKIPDMLAYIESPETAAYNPLEDINYWLECIHAHITPASGDKVKQVLLVGTHLGDHSKNLNKLDQFLKDEVFEAKHHVFARHIHVIEESNATHYFIPVENSIDIQKRPQSYLQESGTKMVQDKVKELTKSMPFLNEDYPIKWLKFEERMLEVGQSSPIMTIDEVKKLAEKSLIHSKDQQKLALDFFHLTGKIICLKLSLKNLKNLYSTAAYEELKDLVVLSPRWLMSVMKVTMELPTDKRIEGLGMSEGQIQRLKEEGVVEYKILQECWKDSVLATSMPLDVGISYVQHILEAYQLIAKTDIFEDENIYLISITKNPADPRPTLFLEDPKFPGMVLTEPPKHFTITSAGQDINLKEDGLHMTILPNSLSHESESVDMTVATSLAGRFSLPDGVEAVSPVYFVKLSKEVEFMNNVKVCIQHNGVPEKGLVFLKTKSHGPKYDFNIMEMTVESLNDSPNWGFVEVKSFSAFAIGGHEKLYSARLYRTVTEGQVRATFCMCPDLDYYKRCCDKIIAGEKSTYNQLRILADEIRLDCSEAKSTCEVTTDKDLITRQEVDAGFPQSLFSRLYSYIVSWFTDSIPSDYPPRIVVTLTPTASCNNGKENITVVEGLDRKYRFYTCSDLTKCRESLKPQVKLSRDLCITDWRREVELDDKFHDYVREYIPSDKQGQLDMELDEHDKFLTIAKHITKWETKLVGPLKLTEQQVADIKEDTRNQPAEITRREVLRVWKSHNHPTATYGKLVNCCLQGEYGTAAKFICKLLAE